MRTGVIATAVLFSGCANQPEGPPRNCVEARAQFSRCVGRFETVSNGTISLNFEAMWYACVPHSKPQLFEGSWAVDFEWSRFYENRRPSPKEAFAAFEGPELAFKRSINAPPSSENKARLWAIRFIGREESCQLFPNTQPTIFVERVIDRKLVWEVQGYPDYTFEETRP
jgi:hypothetical protein